MSALDQLVASLANRVRDHGPTIATEEAVKTSVILPLLQGLGYDIFNPAEVVPEFTADAVGKKGEKVDYALMIDGEVRILIEAKGLATKLDSKHLSQLFRYFTVTKARFALLTNGQVYEFYSDLEEPNKLDKRPFFTFDILDFGANKISELRKFERQNFDVDRILANAERLKYVSLVKQSLTEEMAEPSDELVRLFAGKVYEGRITASVKDIISSALKTAFSELVRDGVRSRLSSALSDDTASDVEDQPIPDDDGIETTEEEIEGMLTVRAIVRDILKVNRVGLRDSKTYCAILVDDNNRKPLARLHFNRKQKYLGLFDQEKEDRVSLSSIDEIYDFADRLRETAKKYSE
ncbi:MAG: type I restriction endonuclease [Marivita sp.]|uniref:type I restriction endonuclease n=1 Tax=Marivita sp. TaxID=2003365 RepID=UPI003EF681FD